MLKSLLVIGAGTLGGRVLASWREMYPDAEIVGETQSERRHESLRVFATPRLRSEEDPERHFARVVLAIPPSSAGESYVDEARRALRFCAPDGRAVLISSSGVYQEGFPVRTCTEQSETSTTSRALTLLRAEEVFRSDPRGCVIRMAGLYSEDRGPHRVYLRIGESSRHPKGLINLIHYEDAASLTHAVLQHAAPLEISLGCDNAPISRVSLAETSARSRRYRELLDNPRPCVFTGQGDPIGKRCDNTATRMQLGWKPKWASIEEWLESPV